MGVIIERKDLARPFGIDDLEWRTLRVRKKKNGDLDAMITPYVTARAIQDRLDDVCHPWNWWNEFRDWKGGQLCGITINTAECGPVTKWDGAPDTNIEKLKGGLSDSMKRAAVQWGIGRSLYLLPPMKAAILNSYHSDANRGEFYDSGTKDREVFWWVPNDDAVKAIETAIKEASK